MISMDNELYFYGYIGDGELKVLPGYKGLYVGEVVAIDEHFYDEVVDAKSVHAFRVRLNSDLVSAFDLAYIGSLEELL